MAGGQPVHRDHGSKEIPVSRVTWTQFGMPDGNAVIHGADVPYLDAPAFIADLRRQGMADVRVLTEQEAAEAWRTHPVRKVNGGRMTDQEARRWFAELAAKMGLPASANYTVAVVCARCAAKVPHDH
jgi:hypothetical protein